MSSMYVKLRLVFPRSGQQISVEMPRPAGEDCERLFGELAPLLRRLRRVYAGDDADLSEDLGGELYLRFRRLLDEYDPARGIPLRPYLIRKLSAAAYTYARQRWQSRRREVGLEADLDGGALLLMSDPTPAWDEALSAQQFHDALLDSIERLPRRQRQVIVSRYYEHHSFEEIAKKMDIRPATARSLLRHGLSALRKQMQVADLVN
jgi:RNA polymerase sigma factor (sigma-70 family)